tara:strand:+ start:17 stop:1033 length:1017 start_codon:yes stop_codon:yes gene_type:complete
MAYTTINKSTANFNTLLYTATGTQSITGAGFQPDMAWVKPRSSAGSHYIADAVRGATKTISSNNTSAEGTQNLFTSFDSDGVSLGSDNWSDNRTAVIWNWKAGGTGSANTDGSINSTVSANTTAGFSIVKYTGNQTSGATVGHGLGAVPAMFIVKNLNDAESWQVYHKNLTSASYHLVLSSNVGQASNTSRWNGVAPTNQVFTLGNNDTVNNVNIPYIAYCFAEKKGYSKIGTYFGNGNADGTFVYTGFKPAFIILKKTNDTANWMIHDNKRLGYNVDNNNLKPNTNEAEATADTLDILSNGFKLRTSGSGENNGKFIYMAFAEEPLVGSNNIPATAR